MQPVIGAKRIFDALKEPVRVLQDVDRSSWVSWICYFIGFVLASALNPAMVGMLKSLSLGLVITVLSHVFFFVSIAFIQKYMAFSLLANSYGSPKRVVTSGVFKYSRNPIYVAFLVPLLALSYFSVVASLVATVLYLVVMTFYVVMNEERDLAAKFGEEYETYKRATPRWLFVF